MQIMGHAQFLENSTMGMDYTIKISRRHKNFFKGQNLLTYIRIGINFHIHCSLPTLVQGIYVTNKYLIPLQTCSY